MKPENKFTSEEARERERAHWFGQPNGNKPSPSAGGSMRQFYAWCENAATLEDLKAYANDETKPAARRKFVQALMGCERVQDFFELTNQTHGQPKQTIEMQDLPAIDCKVFGDE